MARRKTFGNHISFHGIYEIGMDGNRITLPYRFRSAIHGICDGQKALLRFCPIDYNAYEVTPHVSLPEETVSPCEIRQIDAKGRIRLPKPLSKLLRDEGAKTVKLLGAFRFFEIFSPAKLEECQRQIEEDCPVDRAALAVLFPEQE
jgi:DNA-binding transcriptional regulator/RsmH inhibitor MraZ